MELREALTQIYEIRQQVARTEVFRGYRSATVAFTGLVAITAGVIQPVCVPEPMENISGYLALWISAAALSMAVTGWEMLWRCRTANSSYTIVTTTLAIGQFLPAIVAGALVTFVLAVFVPEAVWLLPGLWSIFFSLGVFASYRLLPRAIFWVGAFYLAAGLLCLALARGSAALSAWAMGLPFGFGQVIAACILYWTLERKDVKPEIKND